MTGPGETAVHVTGAAKLGVDSSVNEVELAGQLNTRFPALRERVKGGVRLTGPV